MEALFVVRILRAWVSTSRLGGSDVPDWRNMFVLAELPPEAAAAFGSLMAIMQTTMRRALDVRCCPCPQVGQDEEAMLRMLGSVQVGDRLRAIDEISDWLSPEGLIPALQAAAEFTALLGSNGIWLFHAAVVTPTTDDRCADVGYGVLH